MNKNNKLLILGLLAIFFSLCLVSGVSAASTVYVNTTGNDTTGNGSLENPYQTINKGINSVDDNGTVNIANGNYKGVGNVNLTISKNMTITGQSQKGTIINGTGTNWLFHITPCNTVLIQNLTLTNGNAAYHPTLGQYIGGAIYNENSNLTVTKCTFISNNAYHTNYGGIGGAICNQNPIGFILKDSTFINNTAYTGGAIHNWGLSTGHYTSNIENCTFTNNNATREGGAIQNWGNGGSLTLNITKSTFTNNKATVWGGAILNGGSEGSVILNAHFNRFYNNTAPNSTAILNWNNKTVDAENNWWGTNNPDWNSLINGFTPPTNWVILTVTANHTNINNTQKSTITTDFNHINGGGDLVGGHIPDGIPVNFSLINGSFGSLTSSKSYTHNGIASILFKAASVGVQDVNATLDNQSITTNITINPASDLYLKITSNNNNPTVGQIFTVTYKLGNNGPDNATNVTITIPLPDAFVVSSISGDGNWIYNKTTNTITWTLVNVPVGDPYLYITGKINKAGNYVFGGSITSETYNVNTQGVNPITVEALLVVNAATETIRMQDTGLPIPALFLALLAVFTGLVMPRRK